MNAPRSRVPHISVQEGTEALMVRHLASVAFIGLASIALGAGCSSSTEDVGSAEGKATPPNPATLFDQAETCDRLFTRHASVRDVDMQQGLIRWAAADVPGVT